MRPSVPISFLTTCRHSTPRNVFFTRRLFASTQAQDKGSQNSKPGWEGRHGDDHAVKRDRLDVQGDASQEGMKQHEEGKEGSQAISRKDEGSHNERAQKDHPKAPQPVIGMNDERGSVSFQTISGLVYLLTFRRRDTEHRFGERSATMHIRGALFGGTEASALTTFPRGMIGCRSSQFQQLAHLLLFFRRLLPRRRLERLP